MMGICWYIFVPPLFSLSHCSTLVRSVSHGRLLTGCAPQKGVKLFRSFFFLFLLGEQERTRTLYFAISRYQFRTARYAVNAVALYSLVFSEPAPKLACAHGASVCTDRHGGRLRPLPAQLVLECPENLLVASTRSKLLSCPNTLFPSFPHESDPASRFSRE